jgi:hypothetical protein
MAVAATKFVLMAAATVVGIDAPLPLGAGPICPQMAADLPLQPPGKYQKNQNAWRFDTRGGIKGVFAGSVSTMFGVEPVDKADGAQWQRATAMCEIMPKGGECRVEGPVNFFVKFDDKAYTWHFDQDEKMLFRVKGTVMECEELASVRRDDADV